MGTTNRDASQVTVKKRNMAENAYYNDWKNVTVTPTNGKVSSAVTRPTGAGAAVVAEIKLGCTACFVENNGDQDPNQMRYPPNRS